MQTVIEKKLVAVEKKLAELDGLGNEIKGLEKQLAEIRKRLDARKDLSEILGSLNDNPVSREADALGREIRRSQRKP